MLNPVYITNTHTNLGLTGLGSSSNEDVRHIPQSSRTRASPSHTVSHPGNLGGGGGLISLQNYS